MSILITKCGCAARFQTSLLIPPLINQNNWKSVDSEDTQGCQTANERRVSYRTMKEKSIQFLSHSRASLRYVRIAPSLATDVTKRLFTDASPTGSHKFERLPCRMIIPLPRSFRQKSDAHLTKTKVATGKPRSATRGGSGIANGERKKQSERWWKNRESGRKNKKNTEIERGGWRGGERRKAEERAKARSRTR